MSCCGNQNSICPCGAFIHPAAISNVAGLERISYRIGNYTTFREALLRALPGEVSLTAAQPESAGGSPLSPVYDSVVQLWRPGGTGDLAVQMIEWWAYLADILTFYNERTATQAYLRTADQSITVNRLVRLLGYRPKPGIGATGMLAALMNGTTPFNVPQGFQIQSKPGPGQQPQIFELTSNTIVAPPDQIPVDPQRIPSVSINLTAQTINVLLSGVINGVKPSDQLVFLEKNWAGSDSRYAVGFVQSITPGKDPRGNAYTQIALQNVTLGSDLQKSVTSASAANYRLLKSTQSTRLYQHAPPANWQNQFSRVSSGTNLDVNTFDLIEGEAAELADQLRRRNPPPQTPLTPASTTFVDLQSIVRNINAGDPILFEDPTPTSNTLPQLVSVTGVTELIYFANNPTMPTMAPASSAANPVAGIAIPHTQIGFTPNLIAQWNVTTVQVRHAWQDVGQLIDQAATGVTSTQTSGSDSWTPNDPSPGSSQLPVYAAPGASFTQDEESQNALLEDATGNGAETQVSPGSIPGQANLTVPPSGSPPAQPPPLLTAPLRLLFNLLPVSRGKTVSNEVLGSGNAALAGQDFVLQNSPVTYLQDPASLSGDDYSSTVQVWVNNVKWTEVQSFYRQTPNAQVFITKEDEQGQTHVIFGDGQNGARPPTGVNNIIATYRYGSGASVPAAGSLTTILKPLPGLQAIRNPLPPGGGADPDPPDQVRQYAPRSVVTFGRAVSTDDFQVVAGAAPGATSAQAVFGVNPLSQRPQIQVFVAPPSAVQSALNALLAAADPNRFPAVRAAMPIFASITATLIVDPDADPTTVQANATSALAGQNSGLFVFDPNSGTPGVYILGIGQPVYDSQIYAALQVPGVQAVVSYFFKFGPTLSRPMTSCQRQRHEPSAGNYFALALSNLHLTTSQPTPPK